MAGHSHAKNIMHRKNAGDKKRSRDFTRCLKEIKVAVKAGGCDDKLNPKLRAAKQNARFFNIPNDKISDAIKKIISSGAGEDYEEVYYSASFGEVKLLIKALTDNKIRTVAEVRSVVTKHGGVLQGDKSTFTNLGVIYYPYENMNFAAIFEKAAELDAHSIENIKILNEAPENDDEDSFHDVIEIVCNFKDFADIKNSLEKEFGEAKMSKQDFRSTRQIEVSLETKEKISGAIVALEEIDDVSDIYKNF